MRKGHLRECDCACFTRNVSRKRRHMTSSSEAATTSIWHTGRCRRYIKVVLLLLIIFAPIDCNCTKKACKHSTAIYDTTSTSALTDELLDVSMTSNYSSFTAPYTFNLCKIKVYLKGCSAQDITMYVLDSALTNLDNRSVTAPGDGLVDFNFTGGISLASGSRYHVAVATATTSNSSCTWTYGVQVDPNEKAFQNGAPILYNSQEVEFVFKVYGE